jgi:hypothetical protein
MSFTLYRTATDATLTGPRDIPSQSWYLKTFLIRDKLKHPSLKGRNSYGYSLIIRVADANGDILYTSTLCFLFGGAV